MKQLLSVPRAEKVQDLTVVCSEAQQSSFSLGSWDHFVKVTTHTYIWTQAPHVNKWGVESHGMAEGT